MYSVGIDVAKLRHKGVVIDGSGNLIGKAVIIENRRDAFEEFEARLLALSQDQNEFEIGMEASGPYWLALYEYFVCRGWRVYVYNPLQINAFGKIDLRKCKTDAKDAYRIALFLHKKEGPARPVPERETLCIRELSRMRFRLVDQISDTKRSIINILDRAFPEYASLFSDVFIVSSRRLLQEAVSSEEFAAFDLSELTQLLKKSSRGRFGLMKAQEIIKAAKRSIGLPWLADAAHLEISLLLKQVEFLEDQVTELEAAIAELMAQGPGKEITECLMSVPGIGSTLAAAIWGEIGTIERFESAAALVAFAGIDATVFESGQFIGKRAHMSKRGSPHLRRALWLCADNARHLDPDLNAYYQRKKQEGKHHNTIIGALSRKIVHLLYVLLKEKRPYVPRPAITAEAPA